MSKKIAKEYIEQMYGSGAISSDIYSIEMEEFDDNFDESEFDNMSELEIKKKVLDYLDCCGAIGSDVYSIELDELENGEEEEEDEEENKD